MIHISGRQRPVFVNSMKEQAVNQNFKPGLRLFASTAFNTVTHLEFYAPGPRLHPGPKCPGDTKETCNRQGAVLPTGISGWPMLIIRIYYLKRVFLREGWKSGCMNR